MEIIPGLHRITEVRMTNVYLLLGERMTLVDTGMPGSAGRILEAIRALDRDPAELTRIIITHPHATTSAAWQNSSGGRGPRCWPTRPTFPSSRASVPSQHARGCCCVCSPALRLPCQDLALHR